MKNLINRLYRFFSSEDVVMLQKTLEELRHYNFVNFDGYQDILTLLEDWNVGDSRKLDDVYALLIEKGENSAKFVVVMPPGSFFRLHWHPIGQHEKLTVLKGEVVDLYQRTEVLGPGQSVEYKGQVRHMPRNNSTTEMAYILVEMDFSA